MPAGRPVLKLSTGKVSWPGRKQVFRLVDDQGKLQKDVIALRGESLPGAEPLLKKVMEKGKVEDSYPALKEIRECFTGEFNRLDAQIKAIRNPSIYPVELSPRLKQLREEIEQQVAQTQ